MASPFYLSIADAIARVIGTFPVEALNRISPLAVATDPDDLIEPGADEIQTLADACRADVKTGRADDGILARALMLRWVARGVTKAEAQRRAKRQVTALVRAEEKRLRARDGGWVRPPPPPPHLRRFEVEIALGQMIDDKWQCGQIEIECPVADRSAMMPVVRVTGLQLRRLLLTGEWVIARRDRVDDPRPLTGLHISEAGLAALLDAVRGRLAPPAWVIRRTPAEVDKIRASAGIAPERWTIISPLYEARLWSRQKPPPLVTPEGSADPLEGSADPLEGDRPWARSVGINVKTELPALRFAYLGQRRKPRQT